MKTDITFVLDRSGSMESIRQDTIGGFNSFLRDQKAVTGEATLSLVQFDNIYESVYEAKNIAEAPELAMGTFVPRGSTALLDAIGKTIVKTGARLASVPDISRPDKVIFVILTDGEENASQEFTSAKVNEMIAHQRDVYKWEFIFLGANQDAITSAQAIGISGASAMTYAANAIGAKAVYASMSSAISNVRSGAAASATFSQEDRDAQAKAGA
jgi:uncharacterized protein YegL